MDAKYCIHNHPGFFFNSFVKQPPFIEIEKFKHRCQTGYRGSSRYKLKSKYAVGYSCFCEKIEISKALNIRKYAAN